MHGHRGLRGIRRRSWDFVADATPMYAKRHNAANNGARPLEIETATGRAFVLPACGDCSCLAPPPWPATGIHPMGECEALDCAKKSSATPIEIDPVAVDRFTRLMREQLVSGEVGARKAYPSGAVDATIVSENKIRIVGSNDNIQSTFRPEGQPRPGLANLLRNGAPFGTTPRTLIRLKSLKKRLNVTPRARPPLSRIGEADLARLDAHQEASGQVRT